MQFRALVSRTKVQRASWLIQVACIQLLGHSPDIIPQVRALAPDSASENIRPTAVQTPIQAGYRTVGLPQVGVGSNDFSAADEECCMASGTDGKDGSRTS